MLVVVVVGERKEEILERELEFCPAASGFDCESVLEVG